MKLGTPLYPGAIRAMLLGCGELAKEVAIALQRFGVEVIGVHNMFHYEIEEAPTEGGQ